MLLKMVKISHNKPILDANCINSLIKNSNIFKYFKEKDYSSSV